MDVFSPPCSDANTYSTTFSIILPIVDALLLIMSLLLLMINLILMTNSDNANLPLPLVAPLL